MRPVVVARVQRLLDEKSPEARAIDEQVAADRLTPFQHHGFDEAVGAAQLHVHHAAFRALYASGLGIAPQVPGIETGVELIGVCNVIEGRVLRHIGGRGHELAALCGNGMQRVGSDVLGLAGEKQLQPVLVKRQEAVIVADGPERVEVTIAQAPPVDELDAELERAAHLPHELGLVDPKGPIERLEVRPGRFTDPDRADLLGFDQADGALAPERLGESRRGHPAGAAAADDDDASDT